jgi:hypothetical protein
MSRLVTHGRELRPNQALQPTNPLRWSYFARLNNGDA